MVVLVSLKRQGEKEQVVVRIGKYEFCGGFFLFILLILPL